MIEKLTDIINFKIFKNIPDNLCDNDIFNLPITNKHILVEDSDITKINVSEHIKLIVEAIELINKKKYSKLKDKYVSKYGDASDDDYWDIYVEPSLFFKLDNKYYLFYFKIGYNEAAGTEIEILGLINKVTSKYIILGSENYQLFIRCNNFTWRDTDEKSPQSFMNIDMDDHFIGSYIDNNTKPNIILSVLHKYFTSICNNEL